ncbi:MAG: DUF4142 domain-containing protein [Alphaproteobacteria bacterium]|nr:DUF4142 domain-containing protein [Alphaproteobacteria bacterium]
MNKQCCTSFAKRMILVAAAIPVFLVMACGGATNRNFVRDASVGNLFEIMSSEMAVQRSQNPQVREFAQRMVDEHTAVGNQLKAITSAPNSGLPQPETSLDANHQKMMDALSQAADFDKQYVDQQATAHDSTIALFTDYTKKGTNDALKRFASDTLPTLQDHAQRVSSLKAALAAPTGTTTPETPAGTEAAPEETTAPQGTAAPGSPEGTSGSSAPETTPEGSSAPGDSGSVE